MRGRGQGAGGMLMHHISGGVAPEDARGAAAQRLPWDIPHCTFANRCACLQYLLPPPGVRPVVRAPDLRFTLLNVGSPCAEMCNEYLTVCLEPAI